MLAMALQKEERHWVVVFKVATIYAELSKTMKDQERDHQKLVIAMLQLAADLARRTGSEKLA